MWNQKLMGIAWPAFLAACALELLVFAAVDPLELQSAGHQLAWSRQAIYTASFFVFWAVSLFSGALTVLLAMPAPKIEGRQA